MRPYFPPKGDMKENIIEPEKNIQATIFNIYLL